MSSMLVPLHIAFAGVWLGCVLTEVLFERALLGRGRDEALILAELHKRVDLTVEVPAFVIVLVTGALMIPAAMGGVPLDAMIGTGLLAIVANIYCVWLVLRRAGAANNGDWDAFTRLDRKQHAYGAIVLLGIVAALTIGIYLYWTTR